jgi:hypothetical protein
MIKRVAVTSLATVAMVAALLAWQVRASSDDESKIHPLPLVVENR